MPNTIAKQAFSLVEISIMLVILGLLTGFVLSGQALVRAAELRSITTQYNTYIIAINQFKDKYFSIPGDMTNATQFWGTNLACGGASLNSGTCNGNGDGWVNSYPALGGWEPAMLWQQLNLTGLIEGSYSSYSPANGIIGTNIPSSKLANGAWVIDISMRWDSNTWASTRVAQYDIYSKPKFQALTLGASTGYNLKPSNGIMAAEEAWNIDTKMDDGKADNGKLLVANQPSATTGCIDGPPANAGNTITSGNYQLSDTTETCRLFFVLW